MPPSPRGLSRAAEYSYHHDARRKEAAADHRSYKMPEPHNSPQQRRRNGKKVQCAIHALDAKLKIILFFSGLVLDLGKSPRYGNRHYDRDPLMPELDVRAHVPSSARSSVSRNYGHYGRHKEHDHVADQDDAASYVTGPTTPRARRPDRQWHSPLGSESTEHVESVETSRMKSSSPGTSTPATLDFTKRSPRKYTHQRGGQSALSMASNEFSSLPPEETELMGESDCARALTKAVRQRCYGKESWQKHTRKFDYGLE
ncbi:hypothetical protein F5X98DRAFT_373817 [Xylaria grammica]|nr:hypothetical protein F5X98DRAFT_373817 [Xylaria grammica]